MDHRGTATGIKVLVVGDANTGKSCMLRRLVHGDFFDGYKRTVGAEFLEKDLATDNSGTHVRLMLWDTAGSDVFNALTQSYYQGAGAAVVTFSTVDRASFGNVEGWKQRVESVCGPITIILCQTKFDLFQQTAVSNEEAEQLAMRLKVPFFRTSTKDDFNVSPLFQFTAERCAEMWVAAQSLPSQSLAAAAPVTRPFPLPLAAPAAVPLASGAMPVAPSAALGAPSPLPIPVAPPTTTGAATPAAVPQAGEASSMSSENQRSGKRKKKGKSKEKDKCTLM